MRSLVKLFDLINQMMSNGEELSNQRIVQKLLISLPKSNDSIASDRKYQRSRNH